MKKVFILLMFCVGFTSLIQAQRTETIFSQGGLDLTGIWGGPINTLTSFNDNFDISNGGYFVFELNKNFLIGWTGYGSESTLDDGSRAEIGGHDILLGYNFGSYKAIHPVAYLLTGGGKLKIDESQSDQVFIMQPSIGVEVNVFKWFRVGFDTGYRFVTNVDTQGFSDGDVSSPFVGMRLKFGLTWD